MSHESEISLNPMQQAFQKALESVESGDRIITQSVAEGLRTNADTETVLDTEELNRRIEQAQKIGFDWSAYLGSRRKTRLEPIQIGFEHLTNLISRIVPDQGGRLLYEVAMGMGVFDPINRKFIERTMLGFMLNSPERFKGLESIPGWRNISFHTYYIFGFVTSSKYDQATQNSLYMFLDQSVRAKGDPHNSNLFEMLINWIKLERTV